MSGLLDKILFEVNLADVVFSLAVGEVIKRSHQGLEGFFLVAFLVEFNASLELVFC